MASIAYLGPEGTFTEAALLQMIDAGMVPQHSPAAVRPVPVDSTPATLDAVRDGAAAYACVPIENSIDGSVIPTLDSLAIGTPLQVFAELTLDVAFSIVVKPGRTAADVHTLAAFPVAAAQVRRWLAAHLPTVELRPANSNADAAQQVADGHVDAAVSSPLAGVQRGLSTLADGVVDEANARTRFLLVGRPGQPPARSGADRTSVVLRIDNAPSALVSALAEFGIRVNAVAPGPIDNRAVGGVAPQARKPDTLVGRVGAPREVADAVLYLVSDAAAFVDGEVLMVDGGSAVRFREPPII